MVESTRLSLERAFDLRDWSAQGPLADEAAARLAIVQGLDQVLLTASGTAALDLAALQLELRPGDNVIVPSFAYPTCATAFTRMGADVRFADVDPQSGCLSVESAARMLDNRTRAVLVIHYGGRCWRLDELEALCRAAGVVLIEDCAHALGSSFRGRPAGTVGRYAAFSFHHTKNITCGEGGALGYGSADVDAVARSFWSGTDRLAFLAGKVAAYSWVSEGGSFGLSQFQAALLLDQLDRFASIQARRAQIWRQYSDGFASANHPEIVSTSACDGEDRHSAHIFYIVLPEQSVAERLRRGLLSDGIDARTHYRPLHTASRAQALGLRSDTCEQSVRLANTLLRLPIHVGMSTGDVERVIDRCHAHLS